MLGTRDHHDQGMVKMTKALMKYEDVGVAFYAYDDPNMRVLTHPSLDDFNVRLEASEKTQKNSYRDAAIWIKGEYLDLMGMLDCLQGREVVMSHQLAVEKKIVADSAAMEANKANKTTLTNFWKSKSSKESKAVQL